MGMLRPITKEKLTDVRADVHKGEVIVEEGKEYEMADRLFKENPNIIFFYYWNDSDLIGNQFYTYPIDRDDIEIWKKYLRK